MTDDKPFDFEPFDIKKALLEPSVTYATKESVDSLREFVLSQVDKMSDFVRHDTAGTNDLVFKQTSVVGDLLADFTDLRSKVKSLIDAMQKEIDELRVKEIAELRYAIFQAKPVEGLTA